MPEETPQPIPVKNTFIHFSKTPEEDTIQRSNSDSSLPTQKAFEKEQEKENQQNLAKFTKLFQQINNPRISFEQFLANALKRDENFNLSQYDFLKNVATFLPQDFPNIDLVINQTLEAHKNLESIIQFQQELQKKICTVELMDPESKVRSLLIKDGILKYSPAHIEIARQFFKKHEIIYQWIDFSSPSSTLQPLTKSPSSQQIQPPR